MNPLAGLFSNAIMAEFVDESTMANLIERLLRLKSFDVDVFVKQAVPQTE